MRNSKSRKTNGIEKKLYTAYHQDGILDLTIGVIVLMFGLVILFDQSAFIGMMAIPGALYIPFKQRITTPRLGYIRFEPEKEQRRKLGLALVMGFTAFLGLVAFYAFAGDVPTDYEQLLRDNILLLFGVAMALGLAGVATFLNNSRFYPYAAICIVLVWSAHWLDFSLGWAVITLGGMITAAGAVFLARFLRAYPLNKGEADHG